MGINLFASYAVSSPPSLPPRLPGLRTTSLSRNPTPVSAVRSFFRPKSDRFGRNLNRNGRNRRRRAQNPQDGGALNWKCLFLNEYIQSCGSPDLLVSHLTAKVAPFSLILSTRHLAARIWRPLYDISIISSATIASATAALGATPRTRLRAEPAR
jgi:hypothetical protein